MSFLRLSALWALPLVVIPIVIHLLHRRRQPSMPWAAMLFITRATQARRAPAKLWRYLILATRTLVVAAMILAHARPLSVSQGSLGWLASRTTSDALTLVLVDRSPSMQRRLPSGKTRLSVSLEQVVGTIKMLGGGNVVLIDSVTREPIELAVADRLLTTPFVEGCDSSADVPGMLEVAADYLDSNEAQVADVWLVSDQQQHDWMPESSRWVDVANRLQSKAPAVQVQLIEFSTAAQSNTSIQVTRCNWESAGQGSVDEDSVGQDSGVRLSLRVKRTHPGEFEAGELAPVKALIEMAGKTSVVEIPINVVTDSQSGVTEYLGTLNDHWLPISDRSLAWGTASMATDRLPNDDRSYFSAVDDSGPAIQMALQDSCQALQAAAEVLGNPMLATYTANQIPPALWIWQGELPGEKVKTEINAFVQAGGQMVFFPPSGDAANVSANQFDGVSWKPWSANRADPSPTELDDWRFSLKRFREIQGDVIKVATIADGRCWLGRRPMGSGTAWFCGADVSRADSSLVQDGVALLTILSHAMGDGNAKEVSSDPQAVGWVAGKVPRSLQDRSMQARSMETRPLQSLSSPNVSLDRWTHHAGVFFLDDESSSRCEVVNCPAEESSDVTVTKQQVLRWLPKATWHRIDQTKGGPLAGQPSSEKPDATESGFIREIWTAIWIMLILGMVMEAWLSLPRPNSRFGP